MPHRARYALYYAPPTNHPLTQTASRWLGRDAFGGRVPSRTLPPAWEPLVTDPRRYGFHATLKPPMRLKTEYRSWDLQAAVGRFCRDLKPVLVGRLRIARIGKFFALVPVAAPDELHDFADAVVATFDSFRMPMADDEFARRNTPGLDAAEVKNLKNWGYPYVFDRFRFHMSLTGPVPDDLAADVGAGLARLFEPCLGAPVTIEALTIFVEELPGADFVALSQTELG
ncbi:MAG: putative phosphonate metabolism protein [Proteobacteria bacterium]|nr:putative phosphonate metabolism protein [Pseudomonadota bacterium]